MNNPRSGSSAVSAIFDAHGVWNDKIGGRNRFDTRPGSYCSYEWRDMKAVIRPKLDGAMRPIDKNTRARVDSLIKREVPEDCEWLFKGVPEYFPAFEHLNPKVVAIYRDPKNVLASQWQKTGHKGDYTIEQTKALNEKRLALMSQLVKQYNGFWIDADKVMNGEWDQISNVFTSLGIIFDEEKAGGALDMDLWHFKKEDK